MRLLAYQLLLVTVAHCRKVLFFIKGMYPSLVSFHVFARRKITDIFSKLLLDYNLELVRCRKCIFFGLRYLR